MTSVWSDWQIHQSSYQQEPFWEGLEEYWSDLVNELPDILDGGNHYFMKTLKPSLGQYPAFLGFAGPQEHVYMGAPA